MLNSVSLIGRLVRDPELRYTQNGVPVCSFTLAVDRDIKDSTGERPTDFIDVVSWRSSAEVVSRYGKKGSMLAVAGRLQFRTWVDNSGNNRKAAEIVSEHVYFVGNKRDTNNGENTAQGFAEPETRMQELDDEDELPF